MQTIFKDKETRLNLALVRVQNRLKYYADNCEENDFKDWNNWHDLEQRIKDRLFDNWSNFKNWHYEQFGFNTYS